MSGVELATAYVSIVPEGSKIAPEVKRQFGQVGVEADRAGKDSGKRFSGGFGGAIKGLALGGAGVAVASFFKDAIAGASDLNESSTKINAIFGKAQGAVQAYASKGAKALGQTKLEVLDAAASFGTFGKAAGLQGPKLAKFSTGFAGLSTDLASFFNTDPSQAAEAIGAALRGEAEPIRQYGILLDDATLRNEALRLGLIKTTKTALTPQQKVLAAQAAIYKQTKDAQGDFQRTSGGLANQQRILKAQFSDMRTELGTKLLPVAVKVVTAASDLVTQFQNGTGAGGKIRDVLEDIAGVGKDVAKFFDHLPGGVKKFGAEGAIALLIFSRFSGVMTAASVGLGRYVVGAEAAAARTAALKNGMRNLAGVGGLLAVQDGLHRSNKELGALETTLGGAAVGFALGGPVGAAVGALGGLAAAVHQNNAQMQSLVNTTDTAKVAADDFANTLNAQTGALTKNSRAALVNSLQKNNPDVLSAGSALGLKPETIANALTGTAKAQEKVNAALRQGALSGKLVTFQNGGQARAVDVLTQALYGVKGATDEAADGQAGLYETIGQASNQAKAEALRAHLLSSSLKGIPTKVATKITQPGGPQSLKDVENLIDKYHRTPKQVRTLVRALQLDVTNEQMRILIDRARDLNGRTIAFNVKAKGATGRPGILGAAGARASGGPVRANTPYIVGEKRPELFVPNQNGRIVPRVPKSSGGVASSVAGGSDRFALTITNWQDGTGHIERIAQTTVDSNNAMAGQIERAFG